MNQQFSSLASPVLCLPKKPDFPLASSPALLNLVKARGMRLGAAFALSSATFALILLVGAGNTLAEPVVPRSDSQARVVAIPSRLQCNPVTPDTKVPWIDISQLPDLTRDTAYFEACSDLDYAWTPQSYPNAKYVPVRTPEHEARVDLLLQGIKDYVTAESDDWVAYVNAWLGTLLPLPRVERSSFPNGNVFISSFSVAKNQAATQFKFASKTLGVFGTRIATPSGELVSNRRRMSISDIVGTDFCITPIDLQRTFENQPGYLFQPASVRTARSRPAPQELTKLGGQWFGYQVHVFSRPTTGKYEGLVQFGFGFKPCASSIQIELSESKSAGSKQ